MHISFVLSLVVFLLFAGCANQESAQDLINSATQYHFPTGLENKRINFDFRDKSYACSRTASEYIYTRSFSDSLGYIEDILVSSTDFTRLINKDTATIDQEWSKKYTASVNSVLYFFQIPFVLNDPAAIIELLGTTEINGHVYWSVSVTFNEDQGGEDFEDEFRYWISQADYAIDYFAYSYEVDGGGVRFREAINKRRIEGLLFQDYINYEVEIGTGLDEIPQLFMSGDLKELSRIINENIEVTDLQ